MKLIDLLEDEIKTKSATKILQLQQKKSDLKYFRGMTTPEESAKACDDLKYEIKKLEQEIYGKNTKD